MKTSVNPFLKLLNRVAVGCIADVSGTLIAFVFKAK
jgi:hypothetical protein